MALASWIQGAEAGEQDERREQAFRIKNYMNGFQQNTQGDYVPDSRGQKTAQLQEEKLNQELMYVKQQNMIMESYANTATMTQATTALIGGKAEDANHMIQQNPILKQKLKDTFGVVALKPIDFTRDVNLLKDAGINVDPAKFSSEALQAFNAGLVKAVDAEGKEYITGTHTIANQTNYLNYLTPSQRTEAEQALRKMANVMQGTIKSQEQEAYDKARLGAATAQMKTTEALSDMKLADLQKYLADNPNASIQDYLQHTAIKKPMSPKEQLDTYKGILDVKHKENALVKDKAQLTKTGLSIKKLQAELNKKAQEGKAKKVDLAKYIEKLPEIATKEYNDKNIRTALQIQQATKQKLSSADRGKLDRKITLVKGFNDVTKKMMKLYKGGEADRNVVMQAGQALQKVFGSGTVSKEQAKKVLQSMQLEQSAQMLAFNYINLLSGAAVTDEERKKYIKLILGGDYNTAESTLSSISNFTNTLKKNVEDSLLGISSRVPYDFMHLYHGFKKWEKKEYKAYNLNDVLDIKPKQKQPAKIAPDGRPSLDNFLKGV